ncbi:hypothetical protein [Streptomyces sp. H27-C3]|uniref:hypothetical protein n=1 Tax=Streptomyces sp. H27-C3 TaxID=3046305 RepID=UPI0024BB8BBC|nr:hypothetical protein [Streptomyces sp. H27-C3]MDJ0466122.1 hypothetical protein [Streptomyces sp. H27-C3]
MAEDSKSPLPSGQQWGEGDPARPLYVPAEVKQQADTRAGAESRSLTTVIREGFTLYRHGHLEPVKPQRAPAGSVGGSKALPPTSVRIPPVEWALILERCTVDKQRLGFLVNPSRIATQFLRDVYLAAPPTGAVPAEDAAPNRSVYIPDAVKSRAGRKVKDEGRTLAAVIREAFTLYRYGHLEPTHTLRAAAGTADPDSGPLSTTIRVPTVEWTQITQRCAVDSERLGFGVNPSRIAAQFLAEVYLDAEELDAPAEE